MSSDDGGEKDCPLCMEPLDFDDRNFYPCTCQYQICRFCWHRIRTDENGKCPACRQTYPENPVNFQPAGVDAQKVKAKVKPPKIAKPKNVADARKHLADYRVLQKNLVYVVGLSPKLADVEQLKRHEFFGQFGRILKVVVGTSPATNGSGQPTSHSAYVTYTREDDALRAIWAVNNAFLDGRMLKASLGTTKYCSTFLRGQTCQKTECMYLHSVANESISFTKEDMHAGKHNELEKMLHMSLEARTRAAKKTTPAFNATIAPMRAEKSSSSPLASASAPSPSLSSSPSPTSTPHTTSSVAPITNLAAPIASLAAPIANLAAAKAPDIAFDDDDDLEFDPISVSTQALAELVMEEQRLAQTPPPVANVPTQRLYNNYIMPPSQAYYPYLHECVRAEYLKLREYAASSVASQYPHGL